MATQTVTYKVDKMHANFGFAVRHLVISTVRGHFDDFDAEVTGDEQNPATARATVTVKTGSVNTGVQPRDDHLRSDDFFNAEQYPEMKFTSTAITHEDGNRWKVVGDLTIRDVTKPIELECEVEGPADTPMGRRFGISATGQLNRLEYGLKYHPTMETGGFVVSETVRITIEAEFVHAG